MHKRPYLVTVRASVVVMAESAQDADSWANTHSAEYRHLSEVASTTELTRDTRLPWMWGPDSLVFGADGDLSLSRALDSIPPCPPTPR